MQEAITSKSGPSESSQWRELFLPEYAASTVMLCIGVALFAFTTFLVSTALPSTVQELGGVAYISWAQSLYLAFAIVSGVATAMVTQRFGLRRSLFSATAIFLTGTLFCVFAPAMPACLPGGRCKDWLVDSLRHSVMR